MQAVSQNILITILNKISNSMISVIIDQLFFLRS